MDQHPITPPSELVEKWYEAIDNSSTSWKQELTTQAARWGADQELESCCEWLVANDWEAVHKHLRTARRPKPPSLKEQALLTIEVAVADGRLTADVYNLIRLALEKTIV